MIADYKTLYGALSVLIALIGIAPYFRDTVQGRTTPHVFSWFLWASTTWITAAAQVWDNAGAGAWPMFAVAGICTSIFFLSLRHGEKTITRSDKIMFVIALSAIPLWAVTGNPLLSVIILTAVDVVAFAITVRKCWTNPHGENAFTYGTYGGWQILSLFAMSNYSLITLISPVAMAICNISTTVYLLVRRSWIKRQHAR